MAINLDRRNAFAAAFNLYPNVLEQFARNNCGLVGGVDQQPFNKTEEYVGKIMKICMAQFCVRLLQTRGKNATSAIENFTTEAIDRYHKYQFKLIGGLTITADAKYRAALQHVEQGMADMVFHALAEEAAIIQNAWTAYQNAKIEYNDAVQAGQEMAPFDQKPPEDFDEGGFWHDVFLALTQNQSKNHPRWHEPVQEVVLNHLPEFKSALEPS